MRRSRLWGGTVVSTVVACTALVSVPAANAGGLPPGLTIVAAGFVQPTHVSFGQDNTLYVADIGTGTVSRVDLTHGSTRVLAAGLGFSPGVDVRDDTVFATSTLGNPELGSPPARLVRISEHGRVTVAADTLAWELAHNPDGQSQAVDSTSNPYGVLALPGRTIVADAGANDLLEIRRNGSVRTLTVFPTFTDGECATRPENDPGTFGCDAVPTDVEIGRDGYLYVSGLGAFAQGHIYKVDARTGAIVRTWGGLPPLTGLALGRDGTIYASSLVTDTVLRIHGDDVTSAFVPAPTDVEISRHGQLVVASFAGVVFGVDASAFH